LCSSESVRLVLVERNESKSAGISKRAQADPSKVPSSMRVAASFFLSLVIMRRCAV
jgi:hypothetical protein